MEKAVFRTRRRVEVLCDGGGSRVISAEDAISICVDYRTFGIRMLSGLLCDFFFIGSVRLVDVFPVRPRNDRIIGSLDCTRARKYFRARSDHELIIVRIGPPSTNSQIFCKRQKEVS